jgi:hypothetical protein
MKKKPAFDLDGFEQAAPVLEDLPCGEIARELAEEAIGGEAPRLKDGRWVVGAEADGLRLFVAGDEDVWTIYRHAASDESDATAAASKVHAAIGSKHSEWDADR